MNLSEKKWLHIRVREVPYGVVITFPGPPYYLKEAWYIHKTGMELEELVDNHKFTNALVDFAGVEDIDPALISKMIILKKRLGYRPGRLVLCGMCPDVQEVFRVTRLGVLFTITADEQQGLAELAKPPASSTGNQS
jgi:anti-anti-sigma regulatory factor